MSTDLISIMDTIGLTIGLAVMALTVYTATLSRSAEYGVLKALGARIAQLYRVVLAQAYMSVALGFALGVALTGALTLAVPRMVSNIAMTISVGALVKVGVVSLVIAGLSAVLPIRQIARVDPAQVFKGR
jgi:putative ABC transport system permease protein